MTSVTEHDEILRATREGRRDFWAGALLTFGAVLCGSSAIAIVAFAVVRAFR